MSVSSWRVEGVGGNREVPPAVLLDTRGDESAARVEANLPEEGGARGKHGFPRATRPKAEAAS